ncbi:hypothetical protein DSL72_007892 [Monilinia vaccinii-corymbosi]|uniref:Glycoside hydrolase family 12 protein n=1 Tax=Monilinia vaccinii-corymbosi TaxID=61207 RepID=A0A8A3PJ24_9HELO|nr:hypothetical protein DSL72_007892 [Monilinia vaccinii-corymbosi]
MKFIQSLVSLALAAATVASPTPATLDQRATKICGQYDTLKAGAYTLFGNKWGIKGFVGNQCTTLNWASNDGYISWSTAWSYAGGPGQVKSYANAGLNFAARRVSTISSIPTTWKWSYTGSKVDADVSYDLFSSAAGSGHADYEIMVWVGALNGAGPISFTGKPIATPYIAGHAWELYSGLNDGTKVFTFVAPSPIYNFSGDLKQFLTYLATHNGYPTSQILTTIQSGTEPFTGANAVFTTSSYIVSVH